MNNFAEIPSNSKSPTVIDILSGHLGLYVDKLNIDYNSLDEHCYALLKNHGHPSWSTTPWGRTWPLSCVGSNPSDYMNSVALRGKIHLVKINSYFVNPLKDWLMRLFELPCEPITLRNGLHAPEWALREMHISSEISPHCELTWNPINNIENNSVTDIKFAENFQLSYLYFISVPEEGGELEIYNRKGIEIKDDSPYSLETKYLVPPLKHHILIFNAGYHWHRIKPFFGLNLRIVLGGFVRLNSSRKTLHLYT